MSKTSYQNISEIVQELSSQVGQLDQGNLSLEELEKLVENSKDLYERLVVIRHKAYEQLSTSEVVSEPVKEEIKNELIEEEVVEAKEEVVEEAPAEVEEEQPAFDFAFDMEAAAEEEVEETVEEEVAEEVEEQEEIEEEEVEEEEPEVEEEIVVEESASEEEPTPMAQDVEPHSSSLSLNDLLGDGEQSLRKKLQNSPVEDIPTHISLQKKYEYISDMFGGSNDEYEQAIQILNNCEGAEEARAKLGEYSSNFKWDLENKSIIKFIELVERRYM